MALREMTRPFAFLVLGVLLSGPVWAHEQRINIYEDSAYRYIESNGIPDHATGRFPNSGNPNAIAPQSYTFRIPVYPEKGARPYDYGHDLFGVALNGVPFDPATAEFWRNDRSSGWNYEALSGKLNLGIDQNHAHVQPGGAYHYHGIPDGLVKKKTGSPVLVGYAADGFPVYYASRSPKTSYRVKNGTRPSGPGGTYDGTFVQDYEYVKGLGVLDECNGMEGATSEYPEGIYHYYLTDTFPFVPRCLQGMPDSSFRKKGGGHGAQQQGSQGQGPQRRQGGEMTGQPQGGMGKSGGGPPQEALSACSGKRDGSPCSFQTPHGAMNGTCRTVPEGFSACVPAGRRPG